MVNQLFEQSLNLYRKTLKKWHPVHRGMHWLMSSVPIPLLEQMRGFQTMPDDPLWFRFELLTQRHELETAQHFQRLIRPNMTVLDVGAHVGYYARMFSRLVGEKGRVVAFEPHPRTFQFLSHNLKNSPNVTPLQVAVSDTNGTAELYDYLMMSASGSLHYDESMLSLQKSQVSDSDFAPRIAQDFPVQKFSVKTVRMDDCLQEMGISQVDVVKMDIEGAEMQALRGMKTTIQRSPNLALIMEYNPHALSSSIQPIEALQEVMGMGFRQMQAIQPDGSLQDLTQDKASLKKLTEQLLPYMGVVNMLFTR